jgi:hypothetical protein
MSDGMAWSALIGLGCLMVASPGESATADEGVAPGKIEVRVRIVCASTQGDLVDPPSLAAMKASFTNMKFTAYKLVARKRVALAMGEPVELSLPSPKGATVKLKLERWESGAAYVEIAANPLTTVIRLGREGEIYQQVGTCQDGLLWLVASRVR